MPKVVLAPALARWLTATPAPYRGEFAQTVAGATVREALDQVFQQYPTLRGYVLEDHGGLRHHLVAFVNGVAVQDKADLAGPVGEGDEIYLFQALSGGS
jgi:molybdopterin converting factor small subunit